MPLNNPAIPGKEKLVCLNVAPTPPQLYFHSHKTITVVHKFSFSNVSVSHGNKAIIKFIGL